MNTDIIIGTSCYQNAHHGNLVSITGDGGNAWEFYGQSYKKLAPSWKLYTYWRNNPNNLNDIELIKYYIHEYYYHRLINLNIDELLDTFEKKFGRDIIILCHELPSDSLYMSKKHFCHRNLLADYIELKTGIILPEISIDELGIITYHIRPNYKPILNEIIDKESL